MHDTLIIGLGRIGMGYDLNRAPEKYVLTHARAFSQSPAFRLVGGVDPDAGCRDLFQQAYDCKVFPCIETAIKETNPSVVVVAAPTNQHFDVIQEVFDCGRPLVIVCEKPISYDLDEARSLVRLCEENCCSLYVNYMRCSDVAVNDILRRIEEKQILSPFKGVFWYSKGLLNSGSHLVNLLQYLFGEPKEVRLLASGRVIGDFDIEPDFEVIFPTGKVQFCALAAENYFHNGLELMTANGRLRYDLNGQYVTWENAEPDAVFSGYITLGRKPEVLPTDFKRVQWHFVEQLARAIEGKPANICNGRQALATLEILAKIKDCR